MTEALKDHIKATIDGLRGMRLDDADALITAVADEMGETAGESREIETILDGLRHGCAASVNVDRNGGAMLHVILPGLVYTHEWPDEAKAHDRIKAAIAAMRDGDAA